MHASEAVDTDFRNERRGRLLVVEDDTETRLAVSDLLRDLGHQVDAQSTAEAALERAFHEDYDVVLTDMRMSGMSGLELCARLSREGPRVPVVLMTAFGDVNAAVDALHAGASDFIMKPFDVSELESALGRALARGEDRPERLPEPEVAHDWARLLVGSSAVMTALRGEIASAAKTRANVLITGESGTGKDVVARALHLADSKRGPFVTLSAASAPASLLESELFGSVRGAFTGALEARNGLFRDADGGTLFIDEITDLAPELQAKLLRCLQQRAVRPLGDTREYPIDTCIIAATSLDLDSLVTAGRFRADLAFRLEGLRLTLPPLRERGKDIDELVDHFLARASERSGRELRITDAARRLLSSYDFPGNVRELEHRLEAAATLSPSGVIGVKDFPPALRTKARGAHLRPSGAATLEEIERAHIETALRRTRWNKARAARTLGIDRATLYRKLKRYGLGRHLV
jgi:two-component system response regulator HydG